MSGSVESGSNGAGSALKGLDSALEKIAAAQRKEETTYVGKVTSTSSRATSKRGSVSAASEDVTNVVVSLPASKQNSRGMSVVSSCSLVLTIFHTRTTTSLSRCLLLVLTLFWATALAGGI